MAYVDIAPLQLYCSATVFSSRESRDAPYIPVSRMDRSQTSHGKRVGAPVLKTLEGNRSKLGSIALAPDGTILASGDGGGITSFNRCCTIR
jgi:hypothetical protein